MDKITKLLKTPIILSENEPVVQPIYQTSIFKMPNYTTAVSTEHEVHPDSYYTRWGNPTVRYLENQISILFEKEASLIFPSGMSAITTLLFTLAEPGDTIAISNALYGDTTRFFLEDLKKWGVNIAFFDQTNPHEALERIVSNGARMVYFESLSNPDLSMADFEGIAKICRAAGAISICDCTFTPPGTIKPIDISDVVVNSLTKYLSGHYSAFGGSVSGAKKLMDRLWHTQSLYGAVIDPQAAWNISQGIKTLGLRVTRQSETAHKLAKDLEVNKKVKQVIYPGLDSFRQATFYDRYFRTGGAVISFVLHSPEADIPKFLEGTKIIRLSVSLGGLSSCIEHAEAMSHSMLQAMNETLFNESMASKPNSALIRLSVGIESYEDLRADLFGALNSL
jgi:cystathionine beta-lyase/cystathionine gamma-synthase